MALSPAMLMLGGAARQGLGSIEAADKFYGDLVKNAALNIGNAAQSATNNFPKDVEAGQEWYKRYLSLIERYGKDKADFIALQTDYLDRQDWDAVSSQTVNMMPTDFKYTGKTEPIDVMNERINKNISGAKNQLNSASSMKGMKRYTDFYLGQVPEEFALDPSKLPETTQVAMTDAERTEAAKGVILPTEIVSPTATIMSHIAILNKMGGDVDLAAKTYGIDRNTLLNAKAANTTLDPIKKFAISLVPTDSIDLARINNDTEALEIALWNWNQQVEGMVDIINSQNMTDENQIEKLTGITTDESKFQVGNKEMTFKDLVKRFKDKAKEDNFIYESDAEVRAAVLEWIAANNIQFVQKLKT